MLVCSIFEAALRQAHVVLCGLLHAQKCSDGVIACQFSIMFAVCSCVHACCLSMCACLLCTGFACLDKRYIVLLEF